MRPRPLTYVRTYVPDHMSTYVHTYARRPGRSNRECLSRVQVAAASTYNVRTYVRAYVRIYVPTCMADSGPPILQFHTCHARTSCLRTNVYSTYVRICRCTSTRICMCVNVCTYVRIMITQGEVRRRGCMSGLSFHERPKLLN